MTTTTTLGKADALAAAGVARERLHRWVYSSTTTTTVAQNARIISPPAAVTSLYPCAIPAHICQRESNYRPDVVSANGLWMGKYQFTQSTFNHAVAGAGHPEYVGTPPHLAPEPIQDAAAGWLYSQPGGPCHWGEC